MSRSSDAKIILLHLNRLGQYHSSFATRQTTLATATNAAATLAPRHKPLATCAPVYF